MATARRDRATVIFAAAIVVLIVLSLWWMVFFHRAITNEYRMMRQSLDDAAHVHALRLRVARRVPAAGEFAPDKRFEVREAAQVGPGDAVIRAPWVLRPQVRTLRQLEDHFGGRRRMLLGEGVLLTGLLLSVVAMLYRLVQAERRFRDEMSEFLSRVTHEMKTPLAGIKAVLQVVESERVPAAQVPALASRALREVEREQQLIQNLLLAQRMRQPGASLVREDVDVAAWLAEVVSHRQELPGGVAIALQSDGPVVARADLSALRSIVDNLLDNAAKYGARAVSVHVLRRDQTACIDVADDGMGFAATLGEELFAPFRRTVGASGGQQGTGLGLHISRTLARRMGGDVTAASPGEGQGAVFSVALPLADQRASL